MRHDDCEYVNLPSSRRTKLSEAVLYMQSEEVLLDANSLVETNEVGTINGRSRG